MMRMQSSNYNNNNVFVRPVVVEIVVLVVTTILLLANDTNAVEAEATAASTIDPKSRKGGQGGGECPIVTLIPFTARSQTSQPPDRPLYVPYSHMASAVLAMEHFNTRNTEIIKELGNDEFQIPNCNVYFPLPTQSNDDGDNDNDDNDNGVVVNSIFANDGDNSDMTTKSILDYLYLLRDYNNNHNIKNQQQEQNDIMMMELNGTSTSNNNDTTVVVSAPQQDDESLSLCAILGTFSTAQAEAAATIAAASNVPFVTHSADGARIGRYPIHPMSVRTVVDEYTRGQMLVEYLKLHRGRDYIYTIYNFPVEDVIKGISVTSKTLNVSHRSISIAPPFSESNTKPGSVYDAIRIIKESGYKTIIVAVSKLFVWNPIIREAYNQGLTGDNGYVWMSYDTSDINALTSELTLPGSERDHIFNGMGTVRVLDGYQWRNNKNDNNDDKFLTSWKSQTSNFVHRVNAMHPIQDTTSNGYFQAKNDYFQNYLPSSLSSFMYDSVIAIGMGACHARNATTNNNNKKKNRNRNLQMNLLKPTTSTIFNNIVNVEFNGASGYVKLNDGFSFTRDPSTVAYGVFNFRPSSTIQNTTTGERGYDYVLTSVKLPGQKEWTNIDGEEFIFADGTTIEPMPLRDVYENNYLSTGVRIVGFVLFSISFAIGFLCLLWVYIQRKSKIVQAAQPIFLEVLCLGSMITSLSIITVSFDENQGWTEHQLSHACMATPWCFFLGYVIAYSALFSKVWRLEKVLQGRRRRVVQPYQIAGPAILLLSTSVIILTVWTAVDPYHWERTTIDEFTGETFGVCTSDHSLAYVIPLVAIMFTSTLLAGCMAWKTKDVSEELSETKWIFYAIFAQLQVWVVSIPILTLVKLDGSANAVYLGTVLVIWTFAVSIVLLIVGPRVMDVYRPAAVVAHTHRSSITTSSRCFVTGLENSSSPRLPPAGAGGSSGLTSKSFPSKTPTIPEGAPEEGETERSRSNRESGLSEVTIDA